MCVQQKTLRYVCNCYYYDRAVHISVAVDMRTLLDRNNFSSKSNGQVAARQKAVLPRRLNKGEGVDRDELKGSRLFNDGRFINRT